VDEQMDTNAAPPRTPAGINAAFAAGYNARDVDALAELYEPDAVVTNPDGSIAMGVDDIRAHLEHLVALGGSMTSRNRYAIPNGELALVGADWEVVFDDGREPVCGGSAEVVRRQPDGTWRYVLDHPTGG
jgi:uncharacterized protein (TIGR02246 family)